MKFGVSLVQYEIAFVMQINVYQLCANNDFLGIYFSISPLPPSAGGSRDLISIFVFPFWLNVISFLSFLLYKLTNTQHSGYLLTHPHCHWTHCWFWLNAVCPSPRYLTFIMAVTWWHESILKLLLNYKANSIHMAQVYADLQGYHANNHNSSRRQSHDFPAVDVTSKYQYLFQSFNNLLLLRWIEYVIAQIKRKLG